jgi:hypothetical protein
MRTTAASWGKKKKRRSETTWAAWVAGHLMNMVAYT